MGQALGYLTFSASLSLSFIICLSSNVLLDFLPLFICEIEPLKRSAGSPHSRHG